METQKPTDAEIVASFLNVLCVPLGREIAEHLRQQPELSDRHGLGEVLCGLRQDLEEERKLRQTAERRIDELAAEVDEAAGRIKELMTKLLSDCRTCHWNSGKCDRQGSPCCGRPVGEGVRCGLYKFTDQPRQAPVRGKGTARPRGKCDHCGGEFVVTGKGIYPHDIHGQAYVGGRGDRTKPCPGKAVVIEKERESGPWRAGIRREP